MNLKCILAAARIGTLLACGLTAWSAAQATTPAADDWKAALATVKNVSHPYPWLFTGGQPDSAALAALAAAGVKEIYDLRGRSEPRGFDERSVARSLGLRYVALPSAPEDFGPAKFTALRHHLLAHGPKHPMFIHCATGNRVGVALLPWLVLDEGMSDELALEMARSMGTTDSEMTQRAWDYIRAREPASR
jgi:protein tyrosine phosphatase (PTP) superfamily phosphohydrolase (DUF442 family)